MRRPAFCLLALALTFASPVLAADYGQDDLLGTWNGDVLAMLEEAGML